MKKLLMILVSVFMLTACGGDNSTVNNEQPKEGFTFEVNGTTIKMNEETTNILSALGKEISYFEAPSCAFEGLDKTYTYPGFQLITYPKNDKDYVSSIVLKDDTVVTKEGVYIGDSKTHVVEVYGNDYEDKSGAYVYTKGDSTLEFIFSGDSVMSITYTAITE